MIESGGDINLKFQFLGRVANYKSILHHSHKCESSRMVKGKTDITNLLKAKNDKEVKFLVNGDFVNGDLVRPQGLDYRLTDCDARHACQKC